MERVPEVFARASRLAGAERSRYLEQACAGNPALRAEVESLLGVSAPPIETGAVAHQVRAAAQATKRAREAAGRDPAHTLPDRIGPFRMVRLLGEGGMGTVYEADQLEPVRRRVALKVIKLGMDSREVVLRFEAERQALAVMNHPHIARVLDVGATDEGRPWFAMELVAGVAITEYCDAKRLTTRHRLELFQQACLAVQHAHQKGVIHRDLKPRNIMVTEHEGVAAPKVIDFGLAKAMGTALTDGSLVTQLGHAIGTPAYMSPEQAEGSRLDVDTRTDVYALGVVLYELLTGRLPFDPERTPAREWLERLASGKGGAPAPSSRVSTLEGEQAAQVARSRGLTLQALSKELSGDLDWIVLKAMDPERSRRYQTVSALAADLQRYLDQEPVEARPPTMRYRASKFVRRHRAGVAVAAVLVVALAGFIAVLGVQSVRLARQRDAARTAQASAEREAEAAKRVSDFLVQLFELSDPTKKRGAEVTAKELLDRGSERIEHELQDQPLIRARMLDALGRVHTSLGLYDKAEPLLREALELRRNQLGREHADVAESLASLATLLNERYDPGVAQPFAEEALAIRRKVLGSEDPELAQSLNAVSMLGGQDWTASRPLAEEALAIRRKALGPQHPDVAESLEALGLVLERLGDRPAARREFEEALAIRRRIQGSEHPDVAETLYQLGMLLTYDDPQAGAPYLEEALAIRRKALGREHPALAPTLIDLGRVRRKLGDLDAARPLCEESWAISRKTLTPESIQLARSLLLLARTLSDLGDLEAGLRLYQEVQAVQRKAVGPVHYYFAEALVSLALLHHDHGDQGTADLLLCEAMAIDEEQVPSQAHETKATPGSISDFLLRLLRRHGRSAEADDILRKSGVAATGGQEAALR